MTESASGERRPARRLAVSAALFSAATALSRVLGLVREVIAAQLLEVAGPASAFVVANNIPNTVRSLVADSALGASFVPVFNELLERGERERAWRVASSALTLAILALAALTALGIALAGPLISLTNLAPDQTALAVQMTRILFPILILLGISGLVQAMLNSFGEFALPAIAPVFWNIVIIGALIIAFTFDEPDERALALAIGTLAGTVIQTIVPLPGLRRRGGRLRPLIDLKDPAVRRILILLVPVALGLGFANINITVATYIATYVNPEYAPRAIDAAFRVWMLPQGIFSVAISTVLFPSLARAAAGRDYDRFRHALADGTRLIIFLLLPSSAVIAVLATPTIQVLFERGAWTPDQTPGVAQALVAFSLGLALNGVILLLTRGFFALQHVWVATFAALVNLLVGTVLALLFYRPFGVWGIPLAASLANLVVVPIMWVLMRRRVGTLDNRAVLRLLGLAMVGSALAALGAALAWQGVVLAIGDATFWPRLIGLGAGLLAGAAVYLGAMKALRVPEVDRLHQLLRRRGATA